MQAFLIFIKKICTTFCIFFIGIFSHLISAQEKDFGDYIVYYSTFTTDFLDPKIASTYNIARAHDRILVNISVHKKVFDTDKKTLLNTTPVEATIKGQVSDLIHTHYFNFRPIIEKSAIYYLGEFKAPGRQVYVFDLTIKPQDMQQQLRLRFNEELFATP